MSTGLNEARRVAKEIATEMGTVNADQVQHVLIGQGVDLGPAAGAIFKGSDWEFTGDFVKSERSVNHSRLLRVWRYVGR